MYYEYKCEKCGEAFLINAPMSEAPSADTKLECPDCGGLGARVFSPLKINMNQWINEQYRRTNEPPEELKPGIARLQAESRDLVSYPDKPAKRKKGWQ